VVWLTEEEVTKTKEKVGMIQNHEPISYGRATPDFVHCNPYSWLLEVTANPWLVTFTSVY